jgi:hypothetical protein
MTEALNPEPLLRALHEAGVRHVIIGGFAVNAHGVIRPSRDLAIGPDPRARQSPPASPRLGDLDIMQWVAGIDTEPASAALPPNALNGELGGVPVRVCGLDDLVAMKRAAGRPRDVDDLQRLGAGWWSAPGRTRTCDLRIRSA